MSDDFPFNAAAPEAKSGEPPAGNRSTICTPGSRKPTLNGRTNGDSFWELHTHDSGGSPYDRDDFGVISDPPLPKTENRINEERPWELRANDSSDFS